MPRASKPKSPNGPTPPGRYTALAAQPQGDPDWYSSDSAQLGDAVLNVARLGDAVLISATSDGGALRVLIMADDSRHSHYCANAAEVDQLTDVLQKISE